MWVQQAGRVGRMLGLLGLPPRQPEVGERTDTGGEVRLRHRPFAHRVAVWWGLLGAVAAVVITFRLWRDPLGVPELPSLPLLVFAVVQVGVPAVGAWLGARPSDRRAQAGLMVLVTWGLLAVPSLIGLPAVTAGFPLIPVVGLAIPVVGLVLASRALAPLGRLAASRAPGWGRRLAGLGIAAYGFVYALMPMPAFVAAGEGFWGQLLAGAPWLPASHVLLLAVAVALGVAVARLAAPLALAVAAIVAAHGVELAGSLLLQQLAQPGTGVVSPFPAPTGVVSPFPAQTILAIDLATAVAALAATAWLATCTRHRPAP